MEWFNRLFRRSPNNTKIAISTGGVAPLYPQFGNDIFRSDVVKQALTCIVDEIKKLRPEHIRIVNGDPVPITKDSSVAKVLQDPNPLMTQTEFIEKLTWMLLLNDNAFVIPTYWTWIDKNTGEERRRYEYMYPINPVEVDFIQDAADRLFVRFWFRDGTNTTFPYKDVIHIRHKFSVSEYMGGNEFGQPDNKAILDTVKLNYDLLKGVAKAMNASYTVNGIIKYNTMLDDGEMANAVAEFEKKIRNNESGILPIDIKSEYTPLEHKSQLVDEATLKFVDEKILRNFGVPLDILRGDYSQETYNSFYQKTLEPIVISLSQAFTKKMFTDRERSFGNEIKFYPKELIFMTVQQTLEMINILAPTGGLTENEKRSALGLRPLPELEGKRFMSLNWIDANNADQYQVGKVNVDVVDEQKTED